MEVGSALAMDPITTFVSGLEHIRAYLDEILAAGRIRKGPAPLNLEVPPYELNEAEEKLVIG